jgi:opacity protein-like surface antigen
MIGLFSPGDGMLKTFLTIGLLAGMVSIASVAHAQALPTAVAKLNVQVGGGYTLAAPDYGPSIQGGSGFVDFDFRPHFGVEADIHYIALITPGDLAENTFLFGPRYVYPRGRFSFYAKGLLGFGDLVIQEVQDHPEGGAGRYFAYAVGGGVDIRATKHLAVRAADFEYQHWSFYNGLTPLVFTVGAAYRFR